MNDPLALPCTQCDQCCSNALAQQDAEALHVMRCERCGKDVAMRIKECLICPDETIFSWPCAPSSTVLHQLCCSGCQSPYWQGEERARTDMQSYVQ